MLEMCIRAWKSPVSPTVLQHVSNTSPTRVLTRERRAAHAEFQVTHWTTLTAFSGSFGQSLLSKTTSMPSASCLGYYFYCTSASYCNAWTRAGLGTDPIRPLLTCPTRRTPDSTDTTGQRARAPLPSSLFSSVSHSLFRSHGQVAYSVSR